MAHFFTQDQQKPMEESFVDNERLGIDELKQKMENGVVEFSFLKKNGDIRIAHGTTCMKIVPMSMMCERMGEDINEMVHTSFFDIDKQAWRSLINRNFIAIRKYEAAEDYIRSDAV